MRTRVNGGTASTCGLILVYYFYIDSFAATATPATRSRCLGATFQFKHKFSLFSRMTCVSAATTTATTTAVAAVPAVAAFVAAFAAAPALRHHCLYYHQQHHYHCHCYDY